MAVLPKWAFSLILFAVALLGALLARLAQRKGGNAMMLAEAFVSGGLLNAALVHLLAENMETFESAAGESEEAYPWAPLLCGVGVLVTHFVEACVEPLLERLVAEKPVTTGHGQVVGRKAPEVRSVVSTNTPSDEETHSQTSQQTSSKQEIRLLTGPLLLCALTFHSLVEGLSLGAAQEGHVLDVFFPILAHKGMAAFTLGINWNGIRGYWLALAFFSILSPLGVLIGQTAEGSTASVLLSISAGTFLYIGLVETMPGIRQPWLPSVVGRLAQMGVCAAGFAAMGTLGIWA